MSLRDAGQHLDELNVAVIGISPDAPAAQKRFADKHGLGFTLLSDTDHAVAEKYGAWGEKNMYGKKVEGIVRSSFLIDKENRIVGAWYKIKPEETVPKALSIIEGRRSDSTE